MPHNLPSHKYPGKGRERGWEGCLSGEVSPAWRVAGHLLLPLHHLFFYSPFLHVFKRVSILTQEFSCFHVSYSLPCPEGRGGEASGCWVLSCWLGKATTPLYSASTWICLKSLFSPNLTLGIGCTSSYNIFREHYSNHKAVDYDCLKKLGKDVLHEYYID